MNKKLNNNFSLRKLLLTALVAGPLATLPAPLWALPDVTSTNLTTSTGVTTQVVGSTLNVTSPDKAVLTWQAFGSGASAINAGEVINYFLPNASSSVLNSVTGGAASTISGSILSNGNVYILNPAGIVISATAQINTGGFYASTVAEPSGFFSIEGKLSFQGTSTSNITVQGTGTTVGTTANIQAVGANNQIFLAANAVDIQGGKFFGNLFVKSSGTGANPIVGGPVDTNTQFGSTGPVSINQIGSPLVGGGLNVTTNGSNVVLSGAGANTLTIAPNVLSTTQPLVVNTTGTGTKGTITQGAAAVVANTTGTVVTLTAPATADITLSNVEFITAGATGNNISITDTANGLALNAITAAGTLAVSTDNAVFGGSGNISQGTGNHSVVGAVTLTPKTGGTVAFTGTGNLTFNAFGKNPATTTLSTSGKLTVAAIAIDGDNGLTLTSTAGDIAATGALTSNRGVTLSAVAGKIDGVRIASGAATLTALGDIKLLDGTVPGALNSSRDTVNVTSTTGNISLGRVNSGTTLNITATAGTITTGSLNSNTATIVAAGDIRIGTVVPTYAGTPTVTYSTQNGATQATTAAAQVTMSAPANGSITSIATTVAGSGYTGQPTVTIGASQDASAFNFGIATIAPTPGGALVAGQVVTVDPVTVLLRNTTTIRSNTGSVTMGTIGNQGSNVGITATLGNITTGKIVTTSTINLSAPAASGTITTGIINSSTHQLTNHPVNLTSGSDINFAGGSTVMLNLTSTAGSIKQDVAGSIGITNTGTATFNAAGDITLDKATNAQNIVTVIGGASAANGVRVVDSNDLIIGGLTNYRGAADYSVAPAGNGSIQLGNAAVDSVSFGSTLKLTAAGTGTISTTANNVSVFGNVNLNTTNTAATLGSDVFGIAANYRFGQVSANLGTGALRINENTTLNLGAITAGSVFAQSNAGDIVNTGKINTTGNVTVFARSIFNPGNVTLTDGTNTIGTGAGSLVIANAANVSLVNNGTTRVVAGSTENGKAASGTVQVTVKGSNTDALTFTTANGGDYNMVGFTAPGAVTLTDANSVTLQNLSTPSTNDKAISVTSTNGVVTLGSGIVLGGTGVTSFTANGANGGIMDSSPGIRVNGETSFTSSNSINITQTGHSFGPVNLVTTGANGDKGTANIVYTEGGTANLRSVDINQTNNAAVPAGSLTVVSSGGSIIQSTSATPGAGIIKVPNPTGANNTATFSAPNGGVLLSNPNVAPAVGNSILRPITLTASGNSSIVQGSGVWLANVQVTAGTFDVNTSSAALQAIVQGDGTTIKAYGASSFKTQAGLVTLNAAANNFGAVTVETNVGAAAGANVVLSEIGILNLAQVRTGTAGTFTATSANAGIIQTGTGGVQVGGATVLAAAADGINLNLTGTNNTFGGNTGIKVTTAGNVTIQDGSAITALAGGTTVGGNLTIKNNLMVGGVATGGEIKDLPGVITVNGNVWFDTGTTYNTATDVGARVNIGSSTITMGGIKFNSGKVTIVENDILNIAPGSVASGPVSLTTSKDIISTGAGGGTFQSTLTLNASGNITISNPIFVVGGLTFRALGTVNLTALSQAGNLNGIAPTNLGASKYDGPKP